MKDHLSLNDVIAKLINFDVKQKDGKMDLLYSLVKSTVDAEDNGYIPIGL